MQKTLHEPTLLPAPLPLDVTRPPPLPMWGIDASQLFGAMLDEIEHAMILMEGMQVLHANRAAKHELDAVNHDEHPLFVHHRQLMARRRSDGQVLEDAVMAASARGMRKLLMLGAGDHRVSLAVVPLAGANAHGRVSAFEGASAGASSAVLLVLGKRRVCSDLPVYWYARSHNLTQAETTVLQALCKGKSPGDIASDHDVAISTVRTQLAAIRAKTHMQSLRELVNEVACLPPLVHALTGVMTH